ncbi:MAG: DUF3048 domain-containing protein [Actinomycetota bacterium]|nr:DUF3048 domain-containing protein [Actinomycetota bacterium]
MATVAAGCSGGDSADLSGGGGREPTTTVPKFFPLTGLQATDAAGAANAARPAVTVKIENSRASRPQAGLDVADIVFEAVVEGGQTRFLAVFQSTDADPVGPIRSVRPSDPAVVAPFGGIVAYSGGIQRFVDAMRATGLENFDEDNAGDAFVRRSDRSAPHNLYTSTSSLHDKASDGSPPSKFAEFLPPGQAFAPPGAVPVTQITLVVGRTTTAGYQWDPASSTWARSTDGQLHTAESGAQIAPTTVIVQYVPYESTGEVDTTGAPVSEAKVVGSGDAVIFASGVMVNARWSKPNASSMTTWTDVNGAPISLPAGRTWVEMPAAGAALTTA